MIGFIAGAKALLLSIGAWFTTAFATIAATVTTVGAAKVVGIGALIVGGIAAVLFAGRNIIKALSRKKNLSKQGFVEKALSLGNHEKKKEVKKDKAVRATIRKASRSVFKNVDEKLKKDMLDSRDIDTESKSGRRKLARKLKTFMTDIELNQQSVMDFDSSGELSIEDIEKSLNTRYGQFLLNIDGMTPEVLMRQLAMSRKMELDFDMRNNSGLDEPNVTYGYKDPFREQNGGEEVMRYSMRKWAKYNDMDPKVIKTKFLKGLNMSQMELFLLDHYYPKLHASDIKQDITDRAMRTVGLTEEEIKFARKKFRGSHQAMR